MSPAQLRPERGPRRAASGTRIKAVVPHLPPLEGLPSTNVEVEQASARGLSAGMWLSPVGLLAWYGLYQLGCWAPAVVHWFSAVLAVRLW